MKNSKEYSKKIDQLYIALKRELPKPEEISYDNIVEALVYAIISEHFSESEVKEIIKRFKDNFVDFNDLRVALTAEIIEMVGVNNTIAKQVASSLTSSLAVVFDKYNMVSLESLKKIGKRQAKQALEQLGNISPFAVDYCMLTSLQGHAIPLTSRMMDYLKSNDFIDPDSDYQQIEGFLARQISAKKGGEFYALLRKKSESVEKKVTEKAVPKTKKKAVIKATKKGIKRVTPQKETI